MVCPEMNFLKLANFNILCKLEFQFLIIKWNHTITFIGRVHVFIEKTRFWFLETKIVQKIYLVCRW